MSLPLLRGQVLRDHPLGPQTWFRVGGPADTLFLPADETGLIGFLRHLDPATPVTVLGAASNVIVRDGGIEGAVIRLMGRAFGGFEALDGAKVRVGAGLPDAMAAKKAAEAGIAGLEFLSGIPGTIGGALRMNAGCYGREIADVLVAARAVDRQGRIGYLLPADFGFSYRHTGIAPDLIFLDAILQGEPDEPGAIAGRMQEIAARREASQPIREKTGGSTFANPDPPGTPDQRKAWRLIDEAGCRGARLGGAMVSDKHCNFLINTGEATAADLEGLGEQVREAVKARSGVTLRWEIQRLGRAG